MADLAKIRYLVLLPLLLQIAGVGSAVLADPYISKKQRRALVLVSGLVFCLVAQNVVEYQLDLEGTRILARTVAGILGYSLRPAILAMFFYILAPDCGHGWAWALVGFNAAVHLTALFSGICFSIDGNNAFHRGILGYTCHLVGLALLGGLLARTLGLYRAAPRREAWIPALNAALIVVCVAVDTCLEDRLFPVSCLTIAAVSGCVFYYIWLHLQFVRLHEQDLQARQRIQIMMTQIQPHFLYNTLATIQALCRTDPDKAADITEKFATYLRQNLDALRREDLIPVRKELAHTEVYADIEMVRFPHIHVDYDIADDGFLLPALTIQPLVENAIRHGIRGRTDGMVAISTRRLPDCHEIVVRDNGRGFDAGAGGADASGQACHAPSFGARGKAFPRPLRADGRGADARQQEAGVFSHRGEEYHIGLSNVRERIEKMCGGTLTVASYRGQGTSVTIRIPEP